MIKIKQLKTSEIDFAHHLTEKENWGVMKEELISLHSFSPKSYFIAQEIGSNELIGTISLTPYDTFSFIGNVIVLKEYRGQGIGTQLLKHAIGYSKNLGINTIMLDGIENAIPLYERVGFKKYCKSFRLNGKIQTHNNKISPFVRLMTFDDLGKVFQLDLKHFKADRSALLMDLFTTFPELCKVIERNGVITSFSMGLSRSTNIKLGPWIVDDIEKNPQILIESYQNENLEIHMGILEIHMKALEIVKKFQLKIKFYSIRMIFGEIPSISSGLYAINGPDRG
ncbi:MAG: GNAT family N-acetyltransferase [Candidatus Odinarchaeota archaeon]